MFLIKNYETDETVAITTRREDAVTMTTAPRLPGDPVLFFEEISTTQVLQKNLDEEVDSNCIRGYN